MLVHNRYGTCLNLANKYECKCDANHYGVHCQIEHNDCDTDLDELCGVGVLNCTNLEREDENDREAFKCTCKDGYDVVHNKCVERICNAFFLAKPIVSTPSRVNNLTECLEITKEGGLSVPASSSPQLTKSATFIVDIEFEGDESGNINENEILYYGDNTWAEGGIHYEIYSGQFGMDVFDLGAATFDWIPETNVFYRISVIYDGQKRQITLFVNNVETETKSFPHQNGPTVFIDVGSSATIGGKKSGNSFGEHGRMVLGAFAIADGEYGTGIPQSTSAYYLSYADLMETSEMSNNTRTIRDQSPLSRNAVAVATQEKRGDCGVTITLEPCPGENTRSIRLNSVEALTQCAVMCEEGYRGVGAGVYTCPITGGNVVSDFECQELTCQDDGVDCGEHAYV